MLFLLEVVNFQSITAASIFIPLYDISLVDIYRKEANIIPRGESGRALEPLRRQARNQASCFEISRHSGCFGTFKFIMPVVHVVCLIVVQLLQIQISLYGKGVDFCLLFVLRSGLASRQGS